MIKRARGIAFADPRVFGDKAAFRADIPRAGIAAQRELERQRAHALLRFRNKVHADRIDAPGAELHRSANAGLNFGRNQIGFLQLAHVQRGGGNRHAQRVGQLVDVHGTRSEQPDHFDPLRGRKGLGDLTQALNLPQRKADMFAFVRMK